MTAPEYPFDVPHPAFAWEDENELCYERMTGTTLRATCRVCGRIARWVQRDQKWVPDYDVVSA